MKGSWVTSDVDLHELQEVAGSLVCGKHHVLHLITFRCRQDSLAVEVSGNHVRTRYATLEVAIAIGESRLFICCLTFKKKKTQFSSLSPSTFILIHITLRSMVINIHHLALCSMVIKQVLRPYALWLLHNKPPFKLMLYGY